mmetsp:Transcript_22723/g.44275  ORF Transcript_22723/g.44275 Transcript_22723/m.44275 type:complete len:224 (-) Transcript_22723:375-1046(-)
MANASSAIDGDNAAVGVVETASNHLASLVSEEHLCGGDFHSDKQTLLGEDEEGSHGIVAVDGHREIPGLLELKLNLPLESLVLGRGIELQNLKSRAICCKADKIAWLGASFKSKTCEASSMRRHRWLARVHLDGVDLQNTNNSSSLALRQTAKDEPLFVLRFMVVDDLNGARPVRLRLLLASLEHDLRLSLAFKRPVVHALRRNDRDALFGDPLPEHNRLIDL